MPFPDNTKTILGRVKDILIDGTAYVVSSDGVSITRKADVRIKPLVGSMTPRVVMAFQWFEIQAMLPENTLDNLRIAWSLPGSVSAGANFSTLNLGWAQTLPVHTLQVDGYIFSDYNVPTPKMRRYFFNQVCAYDFKPQQHASGSLVHVHVAFYAYANGGLAAGQEFGNIQSDN